MSTPTHMKFWFYATGNEDVKAAREAAEKYALKITVTTKGWLFGKTKIALESTDPQGAALLYEIAQTMRYI